MPRAARAPRPPTVVLLVRHGLTATTGVMLPGRAPGLHLSDEGRRQADVTASRIARLRRVAAVYTSPLERARETAAPIARARHLAAVVERGLLEVDIGEWTGARIAPLRHRPEWETVQRHPSGFRFPGGESFVEMQARVVSTLARLVERHRHAVVVAVSHADPIKAAVSHALGAHLDLFQRVVIAPASVTAIAYARQGVSVLTVNSTGGDLAALGMA
jgi:probable phosphoglycerate mutase